MNEENKEKYKKLLIDLIPKDGSSKGNTFLIQQLKKKSGNQITADDYWIVRNSLIESGIIEKGRGKGGSVFLATEELTQPLIKKEKKRTSEESLYQPFIKTLEDSWIKDNDIKNFIIEKTANQGRKKTGGKWTRPDVSLVAIKTFAFIPGKIIDVVTFEIKPMDDYGIASVFETASHSVFSHKSYLAIHQPEGRTDSDDFNRIVKHCSTFGVGLIIFEDPSDWGTYETIVDPTRRDPDPSEVNSFIKRQFNSKNQNELLEMLK